MWESRESNPPTSKDSCFQDKYTSPVDDFCCKHDSNESRYHQLNIIAEPALFRDMIPKWNDRLRWFKLLAIRQDEEISGVGWMTSIVCILVVQCIDTWDLQCNPGGLQRAASLVDLIPQQRDIRVISGGKVDSFNSSDLLHFSRYRETGNYVGCK